MIWICSQFNCKSTRAFDEVGSIQFNPAKQYSDSLLHLLLCEVLFALKRPREWCETWLLAAQKVRQTNEAFLSQKEVFPKNVPPLKKDLIRQPWWWQGLHTFGAKRQKESCCQARLVVALCAKMSFIVDFHRETKLSNGSYVSKGHSLHQSSINCCMSRK